MKVLCLYYCGIYFSHIPIFKMLSAVAVVYLPVDLLECQVSENSQKWPQNIQFPAIGQTHQADIAMGAGVLAGFGQELHLKGGVLLLQIGRVNVG